MPARDAATNTRAYTCVTLYVWIPCHRARPQAPAGVLPPGPLPQGSFVCIVTLLVSSHVTSVPFPQTAERIVHKACNMEHVELSESQQVDFDGQHPSAHTDLHIYPVYKVQQQLEETSYDDFTFRSCKTMSSLSRLLNISEKFESSTHIAYTLCFLLFSVRLRS